MWLIGDKGSGKAWGEARNNKMHMAAAFVANVLGFDSEVDTAAILIKLSIRIRRCPPQRKILKD